MAESFSTRKIGLFLEKMTDLKQFLLFLERFFFLNCSANIHCNNLVHFCQIFFLSMGLNYVETTFAIGTTKIYMWHIGVGWDTVKYFSIHY